MGFGDGGGEREARATVPEQCYPGRTRAVLEDGAPLTASEGGELLDRHAALGIKVEVKDALEGRRPALTAFWVWASLEV